MITTEQEFVLRILALLVGLIIVGIGAALASFTERDGFAVALVALGAICIIGALNTE